MKKPGTFLRGNGRRELRVGGNQQAAATVVAGELIEEDQGVPVGIDAAIGTACGKKAARDHPALKIKNSVDEPEVGLGTGGSGGKLRSGAAVV